MDNENTPNHENAIQTAPKKRGRKPAAAKPENVHALNYKEPARCSITGQTEKEAGILFSIDHVKISPDALTILNAQLAKFRADGRQS